MTVLPFKPAAAPHVVPIDVIHLGKQGFMVHLFRSRERRECVSIPCASMHDLQTTLEAIGKVFNAPIPSAASLVWEGRT